MSISLLRRVAGQVLPLNVSDHDQVDELRTLMNAGLIAAFQIRTGDDRARPGRPVVRVLAITQDGRRLLQRSTESGSAHG